VNTTNHPGMIRPKRKPGKHEVRFDKGAGALCTAAFIAAVVWFLVWLLGRWLFIALFAITLFVVVSYGVGMLIEWIQRHAS
jgi:CDP-diglyceride synthetase